MARFGFASHSSVVLKNQIKLSVSTFFRFRRTFQKKEEEKEKISSPCGFFFFSNVFLVTRPSSFLSLVDFLPPSVFRRIFQRNCVDFFFTPRQKKTEKRKKTDADDKRTLSAFFWSFFLVFFSSLVGYHKIPFGFTWLHQVVLGFTEFYWVLLCFFLVFTGFHKVSLGFAEFYWVFTRLVCLLLGSTGFY